VSTQIEPRAGGPTPDGDRRARRIALAAVLLALLLIAGIALVLANRQTPARRNPTTAVPSAQVSSAGGGGGAASPAPTATAAATGPTTAQPTAGAAPPVQNGVPVLPSGWHYYHDVTGFTVAVPDGWSMFRRDGIVYFKDPNGRRLLGIDQTTQPKMDPVADWQAQERYRVSRGDFPGYQRIGIRHVDYHVTAADWEFRYDDHGVRTHVINRGAVFNAHQAYGFYWSTPDNQWATNFANFTLIVNTFQGKP
jgi:hypothetical protein